MIRPTCPTCCRPLSAEHRAVVEELDTIGDALEAGDLATARALLRVLLDRYPDASTRYGMVDVVNWEICAAEAAEEAP